MSRILKQTWSYFQTATDYAYKDPVRSRILDILSTLQRNVQGRAELELTQKVDRPNIVKFEEGFGSSKVTNELIIITEYCSCKFPLFIY